MIIRRISDEIHRSKKSVLLLGPRQTGKSTLMRQLNPDLTINLAEESTFIEFTRNPDELGERLAAKQVHTVFIDEVQRIPSLLNTIQALLDRDGQRIKFYLTGSSARKLRRGNANLLPGRVHTYALGPLASCELGYSMNIKQALSTGTLPGVWNEERVHDQQKTLRSYAATYLKEEIQSEALTRKIEGFSRFVFVAAADAGNFLDMSKLASQASIPRQSGVRYFEILEDTLIVQRCDAFSKSERKRLVQRPRYFFFDVGVLNGLLGNFVVSQDRIGRLFEHFMFNQIVHSAAAHDKDIRISSYRTDHGAEVDFIIELDNKLTALEVKASGNIGKSDLRGFKSFADSYGKKHTAMIAYLGQVPKVIQGIRVLPWQRLLQEIGL